MRGRSHLPRLAAGGYQRLARRDSAGKLDGGTVVLSGPDSRVASDIAVDAMGRLVLAGGGADDQGNLLSGGSFVVARVLESGALDPSFASNGIAVVDFGGAASAQGISIETDGRIFVAGTRARGQDSLPAVDPRPRSRSWPRASRRLEPSILPSALTASSSCRSPPTMTFMPPRSREAEDAVESSPAPRSTRTPPALRRASQSCA